MLYCKLLFDYRFKIIYNESSQNNKLIAEINPFRYRGYYYDIETGLYYLNSRYYDPSTGRFINADGLNFLEQDKINGLNLYAYCGNNPVMNIDPNGNFFLSFLIAGILFGAISGAVVGGIKASKNGTSILGGALGGAIMGGAMGGLLVFGGAVGLGVVIGINGMGGLLLSSAVGIIAGWASYSIEAGFNGNWNILEFGSAGISGFLKGFTTFTIGIIGGSIGANDKMILNLFLRNAITLDKNITYSIAKILLGRKMFLSPIGEFVLKTGIIGGIASGARTLIDWIFSSFKGA